MGSPGRAAGRRRLRRGAGRRRVLRGRGLRLSREPLVTSFTGTVHRQTGVDTPALPPDRPAPTAARYHRAGDPWPLYASLEPATVWAEWRAATRGAIDPTAERRRLWRLEVSALPVLDLRREEVRRALGVELEELTGAREAAQGLAQRARELGAAGMVVPSAARRDAWNLVVMPDGFDRVRTRGSRIRNPA